MKLINCFPNKPLFLRVCFTSVLKTLWENEKLLVRSNFSFSHCVFYPLGELSVFYIEFKIVVCKLFQSGRVQRFVVWERVKSIENIVKSNNLSWFASRWRINEFQNQVKCEK